MSTENTNPTAQGPQAGAETPVTQQPPAPQPPAAQQFEGVQKRIDELTADKHALKRELEEMRAQQLQWLSQIATRPQQTFQPQEQAPDLSDVDPAIKKALEAYTAPIQRQLQQQAQFTAAQNFQAELAARLQGQDPRVALRAQQIAADIVSRGQHMQGFTAQMALTYALGELAPQLLASAQGQRQVQQTQQYNAQPQVITQQSAVPPSAPPQVKAPPDMDDDPDAAAAFYAERLGSKSI